jgi:replicative DNA helicase
MVSSTNSLAYAKIILEKSILRNLIQTSNEMISWCYDGAKSSEQLVDAYEKQVLEITKNINGQGRNNCCSITEAVKEYVKITEERMGKGWGISGIPTGFTDLDRFISGFCPEEYIILASRPSVGKTAFATALARSIAKQGTKVAFFSVEMGKQIIPRMIAQEGRLNLSRLRSGQLNEMEHVNFLTISSKLSELPVEIFYNSSPTELEIKQSARRSKPGLVIIDYIQYCRCSEGSDSKIKRERQISYISSCFKAIARDMGIPVIALSQLNREIEKMNRPPRLSDLRDSGSLEQDADVVMFLHSDTKENNWRDVLVEKNRNGPCGKFRLTFFNESTEFKSHVR